MHQNGKRKALYLIDAMALAYRSHFVFISRPLINSKGQNTSAAFGFTLALLKLIEDHGLDHVVVVFDATDGEGTFRDELYDEYKANRSPMPEDLLANLPYIKDIVRSFDVPVLAVSGVEADDVIGTLAQRAEQDGADVVIVSPDKDFQQLLTDHISIFRPAHRGEAFDPITADSFREKFGIEPIQFIDMLALMGDTSDNVPGVPGIGEKTAAALIQQYGTVEELLACAEDVKGKRAREGLLGHRKEALLSKELVTIKTDCDVEVDWNSFRRGAPNAERLARLFDELEFRTLRERALTDALLRSPKPETRATIAAEAAREEEEAVVVADEDLVQYEVGTVDYGIVRNRPGLEQLAEELMAQEEYAFDTETTSVHPMWASLVGISFSWKEGQGRYVPTPLPDGTTTEEILQVLREPLSRGRKIGQNIKYDLLVMARHGLRVPGPFVDTMVAHYLIAPEEPHNLDGLARKYLKYRMIPISDLLGSGKSQLSMRDVDIDKAGIYSCEDADVTLRLHPILQAELESKGLAEIAATMEFPLVDVLADMELVGIRVDTERLTEISEQLDTQGQMVEREIHMMAGEEFNIGSTQQLGEILFERLNLRVVSKTSKGKASTRESVLEQLASEHPLPGLILDWRKIAKLKNTYVDNLGGLIHPETGRIHSNFNQTVAATGRLSSSDPNLQNIPVRTEMGREIRRAFVPAEGCKLVAADYVQIELRILASMSGDDALGQGFSEGADVHTATAARVFGIPHDEVTRDQRRKAKEVNYGIPYGVSAWGLAQRLRCSMPEAQALIDQYQRSYPEVARHIREVVELARTRGYVETLLGRRRYVPDINAKNRMQRSFAERVAVNMPIQGTQADMIKLAMVRIHRRLREEGFRSRMLLQVHDELVFEVPEDEIDQIKLLIEHEMTSALPLNVPIEVDIDVGENWLDAH